jgi:peroxiredoxin
MVRIPCANPARKTALRGRKAVQRAVFVLGRDDRVRYAEYVADQMREPDYDAALTAARQAAG